MVLIVGGMSEVSRDMRMQDLFFGEEQNVVADGFGADT